LLVFAKPQGWMMLVGTLAVLLVFLSSLCGLPCVVGAIRIVCKGRRAAANIIIILGILCRRHDPDRKLHRRCRLCVAGQRLCAALPGVGGSLTCCNISLAISVSAAAGWCGWRSDHRGDV
jgi:hypothetical protein